MQHAIFTTGARRSTLSIVLGKVGSSFVKADLPGFKSLGAFNLQTSTEWYPRNWIRKLSTTSMNKNCFQSSCFDLKARGEGQHKEMLIWLERKNGAKINMVFFWTPFSTTAHEFSFNFTWWRSYLPPDYQWHTLVAKCFVDDSSSNRPGYQCGGLQ